MIMKPYFKCSDDNTGADTYMLMVYVDNCNFMYVDGAIQSICALDRTDNTYKYLVDADGDRHLISGMHAESIEELILNATMMNCLFGVDDDFAKAIAPATDALKTRNEVERMRKRLDKIRKIATNTINKTDDAMSEE